MDAVVNGRSVRVVALYAEAPDYRPTGSPSRDGSEGIACVDDAARAALVYLRAYEETGDARDRDEAHGLLQFVAAMEQGDGEFLNFIDTRGRPNRDAPSSRKSMSYWAARSVWALAEGVRVFGRLDPARLEGLRGPLDRAVLRIAREVDGGRLIGGSAHCHLRSVAGPAHSPAGGALTGARCACRAHRGAARAALGRDRDGATVGRTARSSRLALACVGFAFDRGARHRCGGSRASGFSRGCQGGSGCALDTVSPCRSDRVRGGAGRHDEMVSADRVRRQPDRGGLPGAGRGHERPQVRGAGGPDSRVAGWREPRRRCHVRRGNRSHVRRHRRRRGCAGEPECRSRVHGRVAARAAGSDAQC